MIFSPITKYELKAVISSSMPCLFRLFCFLITHTPVFSTFRPLSEGSCVTMNSKPAMLFRRASNASRVCIIWNMLGLYMAWVERVALLDVLSKNGDSEKYGRTTDRQMTSSRTACLASPVLVCMPPICWAICGDENTISSSGGLSIPAMACSKARYLQRLIDPRV